MVHDATKNGVAVEVGSDAYAHPKVGAGEWRSCKSEGDGEVAKGAGEDGGVGRRLRSIRT